MAIDIKKFTLAIGQNPVAEVETSLDKIYLYPMFQDDINFLAGLRTEEAVQKFKRLLPRIASFVSALRSEERVFISSDQVSELSVDDLNRLAEAYSEKSFFIKVLPPGGKWRNPAREVGESPFSYIARVVDAEFSRQQESAKASYERLVAPAATLLDSVRESGSRLNDSIGDFNKYLKDDKLVLPGVESFDHVNYMLRQHEKVERERKEELELIRLTGKMTAESAATLRDLAEVSAIFLERFDARDEKSDKDMRRQIGIAVWSFFGGAVLALLGLIVAIAAYYQDMENNNSGDKWQERMLSLIENGARRFEVVEKENMILQERIGRIEAAMRSSKK